MLATSVDFHTNVDCCKPFMRGMSGIAISYINPVVGDQITVYNCSNGNGEGFEYGYGIGDGYRSGVVYETFRN